MGKGNGIQIWLFYLKILMFLTQSHLEGAVMAPPWADPRLNPCASQPRGWQLLFWPPDGKCYKIFQKGHPCPEGMELTPATGKSDKTLSAECRCPPETAQLATDGKCYELFTLGPCQPGYFFGPDTQYKNENSKRQWGVCKQMKLCANRSSIYWPKDDQCYQRHSRGPCTKGQLLTVDGVTKIPSCKCDNHTELRDYRYDDGQCYQHFTRGPCWEKGHLFLPDKTCGCHSLLPHFHEDSGNCFELGTIGPCGQGQLYQLHHETKHALCQCKPGYVEYGDTASCYRPYTRGPCPPKHMFLNSTTCVEQPCDRGHLYFPQKQRCYRVGTRGPCPVSFVVTFDFRTRPSVDGVSYNGVCTCERRDCSQNETETSAVVSVKCDRGGGLVKYRGQCHKMYTQGPCPRGSWLVPRRQGREELFIDGDNELSGYCECVPGYKRTTRGTGFGNETLCVAPSVVLADYLNGNVSSVARVEKIKR